MNVLRRLSKWLAAKPGAEATNVAAPQRQPGPASSRPVGLDLVHQRAKVDASFAAFLTEFSVLVYTELESHQTHDPQVMYHSADHLGFKVADVIWFLNIALAHARGEREITDYPWPFDSPALVQVIEGCATSITVGYLDVPDRYVPKDDNLANLHFGVMVTKGVDPATAMQRAYEMAAFAHSVRNSGKGADPA